MKVGFDQESDLNIEIRQRRLYYPSATMDPIGSLDTLQDWYTPTTQIRLEYGIDLQIYIRPYTLGCYSTSNQEKKNQNTNIN